MKMIEEFKAFAMRGNVVDLAVGVIIGAAFGKIVSALVSDVIMPPIGRLVGNLDFTNLYLSLSEKVTQAQTAYAAVPKPSAAHLPLDRRAKSRAGAGMGRFCHRHAEFRHRGVLHFSDGERHEQADSPRGGRGPAHAHGTTPHRNPRPAQEPALGRSRCDQFQDAARRPTVFPPAIFSTPPRPRRSRRLFCFCRGRAPVPRLRAARCIQTRGRGPARWRRRRDIPALRGERACNNSCNSPFGFSMSAARAQLAEMRRLNSRRMNSRAASNPPSRKIAPSNASNASASADARSRPPLRFLAVAQNQMRAEVKRAGVFGQRAAIDEFGARLGQRAFVECGKFFVKLARQDELQHRVAEKFQPLVVRASPRRFRARRTDASAPGATDFRRGIASRDGFEVRQSSDTEF